MPYITEDQRKAIRHGAPVETEGELNYAVTCLINKWFESKGLKYATINAAIGALECAKQELYRRVASPYEDEKCKKNGDVYG